jgi:hypothetical protein
MYEIENVYSIRAYEEWLVREKARSSDKIDIDFREFRQSWFDICNGPFWEVETWDKLRTAISFLALMNKRHVLYFRGQGAHYKRCLPLLFRDEWHFAGKCFPLNPANRGRYYSLARGLAALVLQVARRVGTPRTYILERVPGAASSVLQHYELWPTHFIDVTRSLPTALAFSEGRRDREEAYLYVFAMPDLRGSITSDMDQHITLSRLEAICPPTAKRPHHQDAYLVTRFPEPVGSAQPGDSSWDDWERKTDLMRRLVAKFQLRFRAGHLLGAPSIDLGFLIPPPEQDEFGRVLCDVVSPVVEEHAAGLAL